MDGYPYGVVLPPLPPIWSVHPPSQQTIWAIKICRLCCAAAIPPLTYPKLPGRRPPAAVKPLLYPAVRRALEPPPRRSSHRVPAVPTNLPRPAPFSSFLPTNHGGAPARLVPAPAVARLSCRPLPPPNPSHARPLRRSLPVAAAHEPVAGRPPPRLARPLPTQLALSSLVLGRHSAPWFPVKPTFNTNAALLGRIPAAPSAGPMRSW